MSASDNITHAQLHAALVYLEQCGAVESLRAGDGRVRYRRRADFDEVELRRLAGDDDPRTAPPAPDRRH